MTAEIAPYVGDLVETRLAPYEFDGKQLAADYHLGAFLMFYNKEILDAAGVNVDDIKTWDDYIEAGKKVTKDGVTMAAIDVTGPFSVRARCSRTAAASTTPTGKLILNTPENVEARPDGGRHGQRPQDRRRRRPAATTARPSSTRRWPNGQFASVWMPQWYMTRFPDNMAGALRQDGRPADAPVRGGRLHDHDGRRHRHGRHRPDPGSRAAARQGLRDLRQAHQGRPEGIWTDLGFDPYRNDVYDDPRPAGTG